MNNRTIFLCICISILGCADVSNSIVPRQKPNDLTSTNASLSRRIPNQHLSPDQLVVKFKTGIPESTKINTRKKYHAKVIKRCNCADESLELWLLNLELLQGNIEEIKGEVSSDPDLEGTDFQYVFTNMSGEPQGFDNMTKMAQLIKPQNSGVTIAIIDSGLNFGHQGFSNRFLYNSSKTNNYCTENNLREISGWDFVSQDNIPEDRYGHGTIVTSIINRSIRDNVKFQILPIRSFDETGKGTYFDILCGFRFASNKEDVDIINMSFGWYNESFQLLPRFIEEKEDILLITSSGNQGNDNDFCSHYPSGYSYPNILSVAAMNSLETNLASFSNYGATSVDVASKGSEIPFFTAFETKYVNGTSFSAAFATVYCAKNYLQGGHPSDQINELVGNSVYKQSLLGKVKYQVVIPMN